MASEHTHEPASLSLTWIQLYLDDKKVGTEGEGGYGKEEEEDSIK